METVPLVYNTRLFRQLLNAARDEAVHVAEACLLRLLLRKLDSEGIAVDEREVALRQHSCQRKTEVAAATA